MTVSLKEQRDETRSKDLAAGSNRLGNILSHLSFAMGSTLIAALMLLCVVNVVVMRKLLNSPIRGAEDILILILILFVAICIPLGARTGAHIEIEIFTDMMPKTIQRGLQLAMRVLGAALLAVMTWRLALAGTHASRFGEVTQQLEVSYEPFYYFLAACFGIYTLFQILDVVQIVRTGSTQNIGLIEEDVL